MYSLFSCSVSIPEIPLSVASVTRWYGIKIVKSGEEPYIDMLILINKTAGF